MPRRKKFRSINLGKKYSAIAGLEGLVAQLNFLGSAVEEQEIYKALFDAGNLVRNEVRSRVPYDPRRKKGTHLRDAIFVSEGDPSKWDGGPNILVGVSAKRAPHRHLVEYGTSKMAARPYWRPGTRAAREGVANSLKGGIGRVIEAAISRQVAGSTAPSFAWTGGGYDQ